MTKNQAKPQESADSAASATQSGPAGSKTLARGLNALEILAEAGSPLSVNELAERLGVHRSNAYRILRTLEEHRFVLRAADGLIRLGPKIAALSRGVSAGLAEIATKPITALAADIGMTVFVTVLDVDEVITIASAEPATVDLSIARKPGTKHSVLVGAPGHMTEAQLTPTQRAEVLGSAEHTKAATLAMKQGYAESLNEVIQGVYSLSVPLKVPGEALAAIAVAHFSEPADKPKLVAKLNAVADQITAGYH